MAKLDSEDLLAAWQVLWGQLEPKWHSTFINDPLVAKIIWYDSEFIYPALKKYRKLSDVLSSITENTFIEDLTETNKLFIEHLEKREILLESRKKKRPQQDKPNPLEMGPLSPPAERSMDELRYQDSGERHWW